MTIKVSVKTYSLSAKSPEYKALVAELTARGLPRFNVWHDPARGNGLQAGEYTIDTKFLWNYQSNSESYRIFDWYDGMVHGTTRRVGHYIEAGPGYDALQEARRNTNKCGYCGHQEAAQRGLVFCDRCIGSQHLKASDLPLLRMLPVCEGMRGGSIKPLSDAELGHLLPLYKEAQLHGNTERDKARIAKSRASIVAKYAQATKAAKEEHDGMIWLMDHGVKTDNVIYYSHTGRFCFGWRNPIGPELYSELVAILCEFCFDYDIKRT